MAEREVVQAGGGNLVGIDHDLVAVRHARDRQRGVDHADPPRRPLLSAGVEAIEGSRWRPLRIEYPPVHDGIEGGQQDLRPVRGQHDDHVAGGRCPGQRGEVVRPVDRRTVVAVVRARNDDRPNRALDQAPQLGADALHGAARLGVRVEQVARDQEKIDPLLQGDVHRPAERGELALELRGGPLPKVRMTSAEMNVSRVEESKHRRAAGLWGLVRARSPRLPSLAAVRVARHCDRSPVTGTSPGVPSVQDDDRGPSIRAAGSESGEPVLSCRLVPRGCALPAGNPSSASG